MPDLLFLKKKTRNILNCRLLQIIGGALSSIFQKLKEKEENVSPSSDNKKDKRSGWPEHVWASELKQTE